jgi:hypothetical protein
MKYFRNGTEITESYLKQEYVDSEGIVVAVVYVLNEGDEPTVCGDGNAVETRYGGKETALPRQFYDRVMDEITAANAAGNRPYNNWVDLAKDVWDEARKQFADSKKS